MYGRCNRCDGTGLVMRPLLTLLCLAAAVGWAAAAYFLVQGYIEDPTSKSVGRRGVLWSIIVIAGPPAALIWLAFGSTLKRVCACRE
jgi:hypothetical protein